MSIVEVVNSSSDVILPLLGCLLAISDQKSSKSLSVPPCLLHSALSAFPGQLLKLL